MLALQNLPGRVQLGTGARAVLMLPSLSKLDRTKQSALQTPPVMQAFARSGTTAQKGRRNRLNASLVRTQRPPALPCALRAPLGSSALLGRSTLLTNHAVLDGSAPRPRLLKRSVLLELTAEMNVSARRLNA